MLLLIFTDSFKTQQHFSQNNKAIHFIENPTGLHL